MVAKICLVFKSSLQRLFVSLCKNGANNEILREHQAEKAFWRIATMAQSAARKSHNLKVVSSNLTGRKILLLRGVCR